MKKILSLLLMISLLLSCIACGMPKGSDLIGEKATSADEATTETSDGEEATNLEDFVSIMNEIKGYGERLYKINMPVQGEYYYSFAAASMGALRFAVEYILWLKGEGDTLASFTADSAYVGWDTIAELNYSSPYPYYFEGLLLDVQGKYEERVEPYTIAANMPYFPQEGLDFCYLKEASVEELTALRDGLRVWESKLYEVYTPNLVGLERGKYFFDGRAIEEKLLECLSKEDYDGAYAYARAELRGNPFEVEGWRGAAFCALMVEDFAGFGAYVDEGLALFPDDEGLSFLKETTMATVLKGSEARRISKPLALNFDSRTERVASDVGVIRLSSGAGDGLIDFRVMNGIDYGRLTQKTGNGARNYPVELQLGELLFQGELSGDMGLSIEEMNEIIRQVLKETGMTIEQIQSVSGFVAQAESEGNWEYGMQILSGLLSYVGVGDVFEKVGAVTVGIKQPGAIKAAIEKLAKTPGVSLGDIFTGVRENKNLDAVDTGVGLGIGVGIDVGLNQLKKLDGKKIAGKVLPVSKAVPFLGAIINTVMVGKEWMDGDKKLDTRLKGLEERAAAVIGFYARCSQRANDIAEEKGKKSRYSIQFNRARNSDSYHFTMWGISNLMMQAELYGVLEAVDVSDDGSGTYQGVLNLELEAVDMASSFDAVFRTKNNFPFKVGIDAWKSAPGGCTYEDIANKKTTLSRSMSGEFTVVVEKRSGKGSSELTLNGYFGSGRDETSFVFDHTINGKSEKVGYSWIEYTTHITSNTIGVASRTYNSVSYAILPLVGLTSEVLWNEEYQNNIADIGTVWKPLESEPKVTIDFGYTKPY